MSLSLRHRSRRTRLAACVIAVLLPVPAAVAAAAPAAAAPVTAGADALDGTCATLRVHDGSGPVGHVVRSGAGYGFTPSAAGATPFRLETTQLGRYAVFGPDGRPAYQSAVGPVLAGDAYGDRADFTVTRVGDRYRFTATVTGQVMGSFLRRLGAAGPSATVALATATGCHTPPDIDPGVTGTAAPGVDGDGRLVGTIDAHAHITAAAAFGGRMHCGEAWASGGAPVARRWRSPAATRTAA